MLAWMLRLGVIIGLYLAASSSFAMSAQKAHQLLAQQQPSLLGQGELVNLYYFGRLGPTSVVGLERVNEEYLPVRWLLIFKHEQLVGWYHPLAEFPARFNKGVLVFPKGLDVPDVNLLPNPPKSIRINNKTIPFILTSDSKLTG